MIHCWKFFELFPLKSQIIKLYACYCLWNLLSYTGASWIVNILFRNCVRILICLADTLSGFLLQSFRIVKQSEIPSGVVGAFSGSVQDRSTLSHVPVSCLVQLSVIWDPSCRYISLLPSIHPCVVSTSLKKTKNTNVFESYWEASLKLGFWLICAHEPDGK